MSSDGEFLDIVTFVEKRGGGKRPVRIGWAKVGQDGKISGNIEGVVNFSFIIEKRRERDDAQRLQPARDARPYGTTGHGASVKHTGTPEQDDFGPEPDDGIPFISQADTIARWMR